LSGSILAYEAKLGAAEAERDALREERNTANNYILDGCGGQEYLDARLAALQAQNRELREALEWIREHANWSFDVRKQAEAAIAKTHP
jgi:hypothetical protein